VFRVVQDQLKVSEGWVRCGRCAKVFNAFEGLFDLEREFPALRSPTPSHTPSQRVLDDLATRNRQPKPSSAWGGDDFDTGSSTRVISPPTSAPTSRPPAGVPAPQAAAQRGPMPAASPPAPIMPPAQAGNTTATPTRPASGAAPPRESMPLAPREEAAVKDDGATIPPVPAVAATKPAPRADVGRPDAAVAPPIAPATPPAVAPAAAAPPPQPAPAKTAARSGVEIAIRDEPTPVPGTEEEVDTAGQDDSFEVLFRSDGEMAQPANAADDVDIMLDAGDVEPASLDDAVDSRLLTFVQQADRAERWRRPRVRVVLALTALALTVLLAGQVLVVQRDAVVAQWPGTRSLVQSLCAPWGCRIEPLRRIDQLGVDSSGLTRIDDGPVYRLMLVLRNRSDMPLLMPSIDLSLTDAAGVLVSRRMLSATDLGTARNTIAAGQELPLQALLMSAERPLTGYTIEIFYP
jgi:predicted Zn finger-like uncharacterized protein